MSKDKQLVIICLLALIVALLNIPEVGAGTPGTTIRLEPADSVVGLNKTFTVQVMIEEVNDLGAFQFELAYNSSILEVEQAALGDFLGSTGRSVVPIGPEVDNEEGRMMFGAISFGGRPGPNGTGVLTTITCIARREGITVLDLLKVQVLDTVTNVQLITVKGGRVIVGGAAAPTPVATATRAPTGIATTEPTSTPEAVATPTLESTTQPAPTLSVTIPPAKTPTKAPPPSPMPSVSIASTETRPTEATTALAVPTVEATQAPVTVTTVPTFTPSTLLSPSPTSRPLPTPLTTIAPSVSTGPSNWIVLGLLLAVLAVAILVVLVLRRRPEE